MLLRSEADRVCGVGAQFCVHQGCVGLQGGLRVRDTGDGLVVNFNQVARVRGDRWSTGEHGGNRLADIADLVKRKWRTSGLSQFRDGALEERHIDALCIDSCQDVDDPHHAPCRLGADRPDARMRMRTAHDAEGECGRKPNVVDEHATALEESRVLHSAQRLSDHPALILLKRVRCPALPGSQTTRAIFMRSPPIRPVTLSTSMMIATPLRSGSARCSTTGEWSNTWSRTAAEFSICARPSKMRLPLPCA